VRLGSFVDFAAQVDVMIAKSALSRKAISRCSTITVGGRSYTLDGRVGAMALCLMGRGPDLNHLAKGSVVFNFDGRSLKIAFHELEELTIED
jgi:hypothetical protein